MTQSAGKSAKKMKKYLVTIEKPIAISFPDSPYKMLREARKTRKNQIKELYNHYSVFSALPIITFVYPLSLQLQSRNKGSNTKPSQNKVFPAFTKFFKVNEILTPTLKLCSDEFYLFITELQIGSYNGAARSLRCILETAVEACEFQSEKHRPTCDILHAKYKAAFYSPNKERQSRIIDLFIRYNVWASFVERYNIYEKTSRIAPSFRELINNLNSLEFFLDAPQVLNELKTSFENLSDYVHPSAGKFVNALDKLTSKRFSFDAAEFDFMFQFGLKVFDISEFLHLRAISKFLNLTNRVFMEKVANMIHPPRNLEGFFFTLPYTKRLSEDTAFTFTDKPLRKERITAKRIKN